MGALIRYDSPGTSDKELSRRTGMAFSKFSSIEKVPCNYKLRLGIRVRFYEAYVRTRLTYCCETRSLTQKQLKCIEPTHIQNRRRLVRERISRISSTEDIRKAKAKSKKGDKGDLESINWEYKYTNQHIMNFAKTPAMGTYTQKQNHRWVAHICISANTFITKQLMSCDEQTKKAGGRRNTVLENILKYQHDVKLKSPEVFLRECYDRKL